MSPAMTNSVHMVLPAWADAMSTHSLLQRFGEIMAVSAVADKPGTVEVAFFDVRDAAKAVQGLGSSTAAFGPQVGLRSVTLAADALFDPDDVPAISASQAAGEGEDEAHTLEFFDIRAAARYLGGADKQEEPVAGPPPGLEVAMPWAMPMCPVKVSITGLPGRLATKPMMEALLQQAGLESCVLGMTIRGCKSRREVVLTAACAASAELCVGHFQWAYFGTSVRASVVGAASAAGRPKSERMRLSSDAAPFFHPMCLLDSSAGLSPQWPSTPTEAPASDSSDEGTPARTLSAEAAVFVPGALVSEAAAKLETSPRGVASDASTDLSESEEERVASPAQA